ncbi:glycoside hydrolase family 115 protein [Desarmillaria tabescens]|uniref:Glycoside hydrolase family 115 protein n=1 Tax=Armillaria tabescens TaxID=1929756 RepID=A0AA39JN59_ARMTA|nr:glycoside hydrolase family 115 protein [Desarmillaria tabescens]KAK0445619.1 glycoside hydrolase family 115 protein [Desarmillaria tabescens]
MLALVLFASLTATLVLQLAASDLSSDIEKVTGVRPTVANSSDQSPSRAIIVGTLGKSTLIEQVMNATGLNVSSIEGQWESFMTAIVDNPISGVDSAYVIIGSDKRGTIYALYEHSEQMGVSPWYWWADVPTAGRSEIFLTSCAHGPPTVKYRGIFLNDEQPCLQNWAAEKFTNGTGAALTGSPFNHLFYTKLYELLLRLKANHLWPGFYFYVSAFAVDDPENQRLADVYGIVMGTSHEEPMTRSTPVEWDLFGTGDWNYTTNSQNIYQFWVEGVERAKPYETIYTVGMRGAGDLPLSETTNIELLEKVVADQRQILTDVFSNVSVETIPQVWTLYKEVEGYYDDGMRVPDDITLLWSDDNWGNMRRFPVESERNRSGGAGVYYHVGDPRDYKWITVYEQMSIAVERDATRIWIVNNFSYHTAWDASLWNPDNLNTFVSSWAQREFGLSIPDANIVQDVIANLTRFNARRKPELLNSTTYSLVNYREPLSTAWDTLVGAATRIYDQLPEETKPSFFQLVYHPVVASANLGKMLISAGLNNLRASQARLSTNDLGGPGAGLETEYHTLLDGDDSMMDQTHIGYYYWQQPMMNSMPPITRVPPKKQALARVMRIAPEGTLAAWFVNPQTVQSLRPDHLLPGLATTLISVHKDTTVLHLTIVLDSFDTFPNRFIDVGAGGPVPFTFSITTNVSWVALNATHGEVSPEDPEQRVYVSVSDWNTLDAGDSYANITFTAHADGQPDLSVPVFFVAHNTMPSLASDFSGFVEGAGVVSMEAAHAIRNTSVDGTYWRELPGIGRTLSGMTPWPRTGHDGGNFTAGSGPSLEYDFFTFSDATEATPVTVYVSPSLNANGLDRPLGVAIALDGEVMSSYFIPPAVPGALPDAWDGLDGFVANSIVPIQLSFSGIEPGSHTLKIFMIEPAVVVQKIVIDVGGLESSYLGPPESLFV